MSRYTEDTPYWERWCTADEVAAAIGLAMGADAEANAALDGYVRLGVLRKRKSEATGIWEYAPLPPPTEEGA